MKILVTGADGLIGSKLVHELRQAGHEVITHSICDGDIASYSFNEITTDWVIHMAARTFVPQSWKEPFDFYRVNTLGTANVLDICRQTGAGITFLSSYVYGIPEIIPVNESHNIAPNTPYNHSKVLAEGLVQFYSKEFHINSVILRPFNIYGPGQAPHFLIPFIMNQVLDPIIKEVTVQDLSPKRDYLFVDDLVRAIILTVGRQGTSIYNVGRGKSYSVEEILLLAMKAVGIEKPYKAVGQRRQGEIDDLFADITLIKQSLGWEPKIEMLEGLRNFLKIGPNDLG